MNDYPEKLGQILRFFESLNEEAKRENLVLFAERARLHTPKEGETFDLQDIRQDQECVDEVGVFLKVNENGGVVLKMTLGNQVQTLTRALAAIVCEGFEGAMIDTILSTKDDFVPKIVGARLVRVRSQTMYYVFKRIQEICRKYVQET